MKDILDLIGRILIAGIFVFEGIDSWLYFDNTMQQMIDYGITWNTELLLNGAIFVLITGSIFLLIGYRTGLATILLAMYWIPVTFIVYHFWNETGYTHRLHKILFMRNMAILGGLLMVYVNGSKGLSVKRLFRAARWPKWRGKL